MSSAPRPSRASSAERSLYRNEDGAIMVIGVFMAIVLCGVLFYISGVGQAVFRRDAMQDAADAVALGTAIGHARGMNLIVFINLVMAALVAIVLALKLIELLLTGLMLILTAISWLVPPAAAAVPIVNSARTVMHDIHSAARDIVDNILIGLNTAERAIADITPLGAVAQAAEHVTKAYGQLIDIAVGVPTRVSLPVENDKYDVLCDRAADMIQSLIEYAVGGVPFIGKVIKLATGVMLKAVENAYCYKDGTKVDSTNIDITRSLPIEPEPGTHCEDDTSSLTQPSDACDAWQKELLDRHPESDGNCVSKTKDETRSKACEDAVALARIQCKPGARPNVDGYSWSTETVNETVVFDPVKWDWVPKVPDGVTYDDSTLKMHNTTDSTDAQSAALAAAQSPETTNFAGAEADANKKHENGTPCDNSAAYNNANTRGGGPAPEELWSDWNTQPYYDEFPGVAMPVCSMRQKAKKDTLPDGGEIPPEPANHRVPPGYEGDHVLRYEAVKHIYGCSQKASIPMKFPADWASTAGSDDGSDKAPQKIEDGVELGSETFQIRGVAAATNGDRRPAFIYEKLKNGAFERNVDPEGWVGAAREAGRVSVAQAEYYFNHDTVTHAKPPDWMWYMDWRARLVRFRMPSDEDNQQQSQNQQTKGSKVDFASLGDAASKGLNLDIADAAKLAPGTPSVESLSSLIVH